MGTSIPLKELNRKNNYNIGNINQGHITQLESNQGDFILDVFQLNNVDPEIIWKLIENAYTKRYLVKGRILNIVKGGFSVGLSGIVAFLPNSHLVKDINSNDSIYLHPKKGDVDIFDQRITHRGMNKQCNDKRILVSFGFGKNNIFTDEFETGTIKRQNDQN